MFATFINCAAVIAGALLGLLLAGRIRDSLKTVVFDGAGITTIVLGVVMAIKTQQPVYLATSLIAGGLVGTLINIDGAILRFGHLLERLLHFKRGSRQSGASAANSSKLATPAPTESTPTTAEAHSERDFGHAFLNASVLFCVGAMSLVGSFNAGTSGDYTLILTKSVLDGFMAILLAAAMGPGVAFSALPILLYQGGLTLGASFLQPFVSDLMLNELTAVGGAMILMIGFNLLSLKQLKTANFLPALVVTVLLILAHPFILHIASLMGLS